MNICQIITPSKIAGAERSTTSLCEHLQAAGHRVVVGCKAGSPLIPAMREVGLDARPLAHVRALNTPFWYQWATRVIAVSHAVKEHLVRHGMDAAKVDVVYNGVD